MLRLVLRRARVRLAVGLLVVGSFPLWMPGDLSRRAWILAGLALLLPWMVLGRDARRRAEGLRAALLSAPRTPRLVVLELLPALFVAASGALVGTGGAPGPALGVFAWGAALVTMADRLDRRAAHAGAAWPPLFLGALVVWTAPLWAAPWFAQTPWSPWPATLAIGLHPAAVAVTAGGQSALQDPLFYTFTQSGVLEVRPLAWQWGAALFGLVAVTGALSAIRAARTPPRSFA